MEFNKFEIACLERELASFKKIVALLEEKIAKSCISISEAKERETKLIEAALLLGDENVPPYAERKVYEYANLDELK